MFGTNLAKGAGLTCTNGTGMKLMLDNNSATHFTTNGTDTTTVITFKLKGKQSFDVLLLQENIRVGQRIEQFSLECLVNGQWVRATEGTTVGYKRLVQLPEVSTDQVRLTILSSRLNPTIAEFGLYKDKGKIRE